MLRPATGCAVPHSSVSAIGNIGCDLPLCCQLFIPRISRGGSPVTVFVSYSTRDKDAVKSLTQDLQDADEQVWMDQRLAGGDAWWRAILEQIRGCDVFIFAFRKTPPIRALSGRTALRANSRAADPSSAGRPGRQHAAQSAGHGAGNRLPHINAQHRHATNRRAEPGAGTASTATLTVA